MKRKECQVLFFINRRVLVEAGGYLYYLGSILYVYNI